MWRLGALMNDLAYKRFQWETSPAHLQWETALSPPLQPTIFIGSAKKVFYHYKWSEMFPH